MTGLLKQLLPAMLALLVLTGRAAEINPALLTDFAELAHYADANAALRATERHPDIVFIGDSITAGWIDSQPDYFGPTRIDRGIGGQTSAQMLLRFRQDVIDLAPKAVHIMAGTNDIAGNTGPMTAEMTEANIMSMVDLAKAHRIVIILASIPPAAGFPWRPGLETSDKIRRLNGWLRTYAADNALVYVDYWAALQDGRGGMRAGLAYDGVHPTIAGYTVMQPLCDAALTAALGQK